MRSTWLALAIVAGSTPAFANDAAVTASLLPALREPAAFALFVLGAAVFGVAIRGRSG